MMALRVFSPPARALVWCALAAGFSVACATAPSPKVEGAPGSNSPYGEAPALVNHSVAPGMSLARIERYLQNRSARISAPRPGVWHLSLDGVLVLMIAEDSRVRILAPIFALHQLDGDPAVQSALMVRLLQANFDRSADARYAIFDGIVFAAITHPRATLREEDLDLFLRQVVNLHKNTFRTGMRGYSSLAPEADSIEIDPRHDDSLLEPEVFEKRDADQIPPSVREHHERPLPQSTESNKKLFL
jgi:hypothetical protein